ncbi:MAG: cysteine-rich CWC family protein [Candidatus Puniceispirillaceae bacterium]
MQTLQCTNCGTQFNCGSTPTRNCWCVNLPNMHDQFDLADSCLCPDCMTKGQAKAITRQRKSRKAQRQAERDLLR